MNRIRPYREFLALWVGLVGLAIPAGAVTNGTTVVSFAVKCTDIACEYIVTFTGDDNANNSFLIQYRKTGASTFLNAYKPYIDRRARVNGTANPYYRTARGSVLIGTGLDNTSFDFQATARCSGHESDHAGRFLHADRLLGWCVFHIQSESDSGGRHLQCVGRCGHRDSDRGIMWACGYRVECDPGSNHLDSGRNGE
jgi:hypothetical protein